MDPNEIKEYIHEQIQLSLTEINGTVKKLVSDVERHETSLLLIPKISTDIAVMKSEFSAFGTKLDDMVIKLTKLSEVPAKRLDGIITALVSAIIGAVIVYLTK